MKLIFLSVLGSLLFAFEVLGGCPPNSSPYGEPIEAVGVGGPIPKPGAIINACTAANGLAVDAAHSNAQEQCDQLLPNPPGATHYLVPGSLVQSPLVGQGTNGTSCNCFQFNPDEWTCDTQHTYRAQCCQIED